MIPGNTPLKQNQLLSEHEYREARETYGAEAFVAKMGAEAVREALCKVDLAKQVEQLQEGMTETKSKQIRKKIAKRIKLLQGFMALQEPAGMDDPDRAAGDSAGPAPAGAARRRSFCDVRSRTISIAASSTGTTG